MIELKIILSAYYGARFTITLNDKGYSIDQDTFDRASDEEILDALKLFSLEVEDVEIELHPKFNDTEDCSLYNAELHVVNKLLNAKLDDYDVRGFVEEALKTWSFGR